SAGRLRVCRTYAERGEHTTFGTPKLRNHNNMQHDAERCRTFSSNSAYTRAHLRPCDTHACIKKSVGQTFGRFGRFGSRPPIRLCRPPVAWIATASRTFAPVAQIAAPGDDDPNRGVAATRGHTVALAASARVAERIPEGMVPSRPRITGEVRGNSRLT